MTRTTTELASLRKSLLELGSATLHEAISPGDWIMGDRDGVVVIPRGNVSAVIAAAKEREAAEIALRKGIEAGKSTVELLGLQASLRRAGLERR